MPPPQHQPTRRAWPIDQPLTEWAESEVPIRRFCHDLEGGERAEQAPERGRMGPCLYGKSFGTARPPCEQIRKAQPRAGMQCA